MENLWKNFGKPKETTKTMENLWKTYRKTVEKTMESMENQSKKLMEFIWDTFSSPTGTLDGN